MSPGEAMPLVETHSLSIGVTIAIRCYCALITTALAVANLTIVVAHNGASDRVTGEVGRSEAPNGPLSAAPCLRSGAASVRPASTSAATLPLGSEFSVGGLSASPGLVHGDSRGTVQPLRISRRQHNSQCTSATISIYAMVDPPAASRTPRLIQIVRGIVAESFPFPFMAAE
jgi:hypothetical protein